MGSTDATPSGHPCPGCGASIPCGEVACRRCRRRLPRRLRHELVLAERVRHRDHETYLDVLREAKQWWDEHQERSA